MKHSLRLALVLMIGASMMSCSKQKNGESVASDSAATVDTPEQKAQRKEVMTVTGFDEDVTRWLQEESEHPLRVFEGWNPSTSRKEELGVQADMSEQEADVFRELVNAKWERRGYRAAFVRRIETPRGAGRQPWVTMAVIRAEDALDFVEVMQVDLLNGQKPAAVAATLAQLRSEFPFDFVGCGDDFLELEFSNPRTDLDPLAPIILEWLGRSPAKRWEDAAELISEFDDCRCLKLAW